MLLSLIAKGRHDCLKDNEEPKDLLVSVTLKRELVRELETPMSGRIDPDGSIVVMGMKVEWVPPKPLNRPQLSIRTVKGDVRILSHYGD